MKKEDFVSTLVMTTVSIMMLVGVTIAWYTTAYAQATVTGMNLKAQEVGSIKVALEKGGKDISELAEEDRYADIGLTELHNIADGQMAPGAYGELAFYVTALNKSTTSCQIVPSLVPGYEDGVADETTITINQVEKVASEVLEIHFDFFADEDMTIPVNEDEPMTVVLIDENKNELKWDTEKKTGQEVPVTIYWKWHYEYPFTQEELDTMSEDAEKAAIYDYDMEDTWIGTHLETMSFHFDFLTPQ